MFKIINGILSMIGAMTLSFGGMAAVTQADYLEIGVISLCVGLMVGLFNLLSMQEEENNEK